MNIQEKINRAIQLAMKNKEVGKLAALRAVKSAFLLEATKDSKSEITNEIAIDIISKLVKQRNDAADIFLDQGRKDLAEEEISQINYLQLYLPKKMNRDEVRVKVKEKIKEIGASSIADFGNCMAVLMKDLKGKADGKIISELVKEEITR